jgi:hypothetical protein
VEDPAVQRLARAAVAQFKSITLRNFFSETTCDIEMDIYRMDFDSLDLYCQAVQSNKKELLSDCHDPGVKVLWLRRQLASPHASVSDPKTAEVLRKYALHRYGGKLQLVRTIEESKSDEAGHFHPSLGELVRCLLQLKEAAAIQGNKEDAKLLESLERYIRASDIVRVAGRDLVPHWVL